MPRNGRDEPKPDEPKKVQPIVASKLLAQRMMTYTQSQIPVRTIIFMEVGDMPAADVKQAMTHAKTIHGEGVHPTYIIPVRRRKLAGDILFEEEILAMVNKLCEVEDGQIALRGGTQDVDIMRTQL